MSKSRPTFHSLLTTYYSLLITHYSLLTLLLSDTLTTAFRAILVNKSRTLLTMLGIIIGVASVVLMVSIGTTFQNFIVSQVESFGTNTMDIIPKGFQKFGGNLDSLTFEDFRAIDALSTTDQVVPVILVSQPISYGKEEVSPMILASYATILKNYGLTIAEGRALSDDDERGAKSVAVIGSKTAEDLFGSTSPLLKRMTIGDASFTVVGVLKPLGSFLLQDMDSMVFIPYSVGKAVTGQKHLSYITLKAVGDPELAKQDVVSVLRERHHIKNPENDPDKDDFIARSAEQVTQVIGAVTSGLTIFLALIAAISLLVGGIGIMNIMLVSVTERTREIGLRKALGARRKDILLQFLFEAVALTLSGGGIGLVLGVYSGWFLTQVASKFLGNITFILSFSAVILAVLMAVGTGLVFGLYPARKAASLSPMEALRYE